MPDGNESYRASGEVGVSRFVRGVRGAVGRVAESGASPGLDLLGVSQEGSYAAPGLELAGGPTTNLPAAPDGKFLKVYGLGDRCVLVAGANVSAQSLLVPDANSFGVPASTTATASPEAIGFRAFENAVSGGLVRGRVELRSYITN